MAPMMWHSLGPNLDDSSGKPLATLLRPQNGILPHIRGLYVDNTAIDTGAEDRIRLLLSALPRDRPTVFTAVKSISPLKVQMLLQSQRELQKLQVRVVDDPSYVGDGHVPFSESWAIKRRSSCEDLSYRRSRWLVNRVLNAASHSRITTTLTSTFPLQHLSDWASLAATTSLRS
jgi:hypothetical protein